MTNIYILKLQQGKYYVGKTDNLEKRKQQHINGTACSWTKLIYIKNKINYLYYIYKCLIQH